MEKEKKDNSKNNDSDQIKTPSILKDLASNENVGFGIAVPIAGSALLGVFLDNKFGTAPKLTLLFLFLGIVIAFSYLVRLIKGK